MTASLTVGVPTEIKDNENRVAMQPDGVAELTAAATLCLSRQALARDPDLAMGSSPRQVPPSWLTPMPSSVQRISL